MVSSKLLKVTKAHGARGNRALPIGFGLIKAFQVITGQDSMMNVLA